MTKKKPEEWVDVEGGDCLVPTCPYCHKSFKPSPDCVLRRRKCKGCGKTFKYWACYYTAIKVKKGEE